MCKAPFKSIIHNVSSKDSYDQVLILYICIVFVSTEGSATTLMGLTWNQESNYHFFL